MSPLTCKVIRRQIDIWIVSVVSILWILIPVSHLDSVSSVFLLDYGSHALALDCDPGLTLDSVYISDLWAGLTDEFFKNGMERDVKATF